MSPEARARQRTDELLTAAGWHVCDFKAAHLHAARGVAIREIELAADYRSACYSVSGYGRAAGVAVPAIGTVLVLDEGSRALVVFVCNSHVVFTGKR